MSRGGLIITLSESIRKNMFGAVHFEKGPHQR